MKYLYVTKRVSLGSELKKNNLVQKFHELRYLNYITKNTSL